MADNLTTILGNCHENLGTLTSWNPVGLSRPVTGLLYLLVCYSGTYRMSEGSRVSEKQYMNREHL